jgi:phenylpyruvate tautomerase PptA (4-oxalocrotonate tautomerase family)
MPYLQLDVPAHYPLEVKRDLAQRMGAQFAELMQTTPDLVNIAFRELGEGGVWSTGAGTPVPSAVLSLAIRRGRTPEQRERLAEAMHATVTEALGLDPVSLTIEYSYHAGNDIYKKRYVDGALRGGLGRDWTPDEAEHPLLESLDQEIRDSGTVRGEL